MEASEEAKREAPSPLEARPRPPMPDPEPHLELHPPLAAPCHDMSYVVVGCCAIPQQP